MKQCYYKNILMFSVFFSMLGIFSSYAQVNYDYVYRYAGNTTPGYSGDGGLATSAKIEWVTGMAFDSKNNLYMADYVHHVIRRVDAITGIITTVAGNGTAGFSGDGGPATSAVLRYPVSITIDKYDNIYFSDQLGGVTAANTRIRKIDAGSGIITTVAGTGTWGHTGDGGAATSANIQAWGIDIDAYGNLFIAEIAYVRKVDGSGIITSIAGTGTAGCTGSGGSAMSADVNPYSITVDKAGNLYITEHNYNVVRKIDVAGDIFLVAGTPGVPGSSGDLGPASAALLYDPKKVEIDALGNLYIVDRVNMSVRKITPGGVINKIAGTGTFGINAMCQHPLLTKLGEPITLAMNSDNYLFISDDAYPRILMLSDGLKIKDVDINTLCVPGYSTPAVTPKFTVTTMGGVPPFTYSWTALTGNNTTLSSLSSRTPSVSSTASPYLAYFNLSVGDNSGCSGSASRKVKATLNTNQTFDLAARDSYFDMYDEPNSQKTVNPVADNFYKSPDLWNRSNPDGLKWEQDPCYGLGCNNNMYVRVRNVGCKASGTQKQVKLYWTMAGVPETWPDAWTTAVYNPGLSCPLCPLPMGGYITGITLPSINPGDFKEYNTAWTPPDPLDYFYYISGVDRKMGTCFLARIEDGPLPFPEVPTLIDNVINNNNIVTRNSWVTRINDYEPRLITISVGSTATSSAVYSLRFRNLDPGNSTLYQYMQVTLYLGPVYDLWVNGGSVGSYASTDPVAKTVTFDGTNDMLLENITFAPNDQFFIDLVYEMLPSVNGVEMRNEEVIFEQLYTVQNVTELYGAVNTMITYDGQVAGPDPVPSVDLSRQDAARAQVKVFPNPASTILYIDLPAESSGSVELMDLSGRVVAESVIDKRKTVSVDVRTLPQGLYFYKVQTAGTLKTGSVLIGK